MFQTSVNYQKCSIFIYNNLNVNNKLYYIFKENVIQIRINMDEYNFDAILTYLALDTFNASFLAKLGQSKFPLELS